MDKEEKISILLFKNLIFTILLPGVVAIVLPYRIGIKDKVLPVQFWNFFQYGGLLLVFVGSVMLLSCIVNFAFKGKGTLSPAFPAKKLVTTGLYCYSRNPMYIGVMLVLAGEMLFVLSLSLLIYSIIVFACFHTFIILHEEPRLRRVFGAEYENYTKKVRRWI